VYYLKSIFTGIYNPRLVLIELDSRDSLKTGITFVLIRFIITTLTSPLLLYLLGRVPFASSQLVNLPIKSYYFAEIFFLPIWGIFIWLLMGSFTYLLLRLINKNIVIDKIFNIIGLGMIIPMPLLWLWDWTAIALNIYTVIPQAISHSIAQVWEGTIEAMGFKQLLKLKTKTAIGIAVIINLVYISLAMMFIR
jgi:hypothetical protein